MIFSFFTELHQQLNFENILSPPQKKKKNITWCTTQISLFAKCFSYLILGFFQLNMEKLVSKRYIKRLKTLWEEGQCKALAPNLMP